jgi:predicted Zn-dependent protease
VIRSQDLVERALAASRTEGCVVIVEEGDGVELRWAGNALTTDAVNKRRRLSVVAIDGARTGTVAAAGQLAPDDVVDLVRAAESAARQAEPAADARALPPAVPGTGWTDPVPTTSPGVLGGLVAELSGCLDAARTGGQVLHGFAQHRNESTFLGTSQGARLRHDQPGAHLELAARPGCGGESVWDVAVADDLARISVRSLHERLEERLRWTRRRVELPAGRYECLLPPTAVADLMNYAYTSADARAAADGLSVYSRPGGGTRVGERLSDTALTLRSDPGAPGLACRPFVVAASSDATRSVFDNGLPLAPTVWWEGGVLRSLVQTRDTAHRYGVPLTPAVDNLILEGPGEPRSTAELVAGTRRGLLLTSLWYIREVDPRALRVTGLTRDGVFLVENGEIVGAVHNFRFDESPVSLLGRVSEAGATVPTRARDWGDAVSRTAMPTLRVQDFLMSAVTRAV